MTDVIRITMWSGPRNVSTAMMRSFENRSDTSVSDEPFYAAYLRATGLNHPMRDAVLASQPHDPAAVIAALLGPVPDGQTIWYQKHMTHHMLPDFDRNWLDQVTNAFLVRRPEAVLASYVERRAEVTLADIGLPQQVEIFERVADRLGAAPPVLEGADVLAAPQSALSALCRRCGIPFDAAMLAWPAGPRPSDGAWAPAWYDKVEASTGFGPPRAEVAFAELRDDLKPIAEAAQPYYERLARHRIGVKLS
ncbi:sulfotransferase-like domain-containing protein [Lichenifustis flavocetrariae]|uniref:HAD family hydrolase n=1 Tax=Lichenifustis flavocetrariae TaxID=2949735 RepID=A0AA42CKV9_9HYPH|nr:hypothetical protein [Lichenifustis flavocetrariae]MCW6506752.1 hypothetical protein [Lichenifustis flavocetrariae]